jgi:hypothetical protein
MTPFPPEMAFWLQRFVEHAVELMYWLMIAWVGIYVGLLLVLVILLRKSKP